MEFKNNLDPDTSPNPFLPGIAELKNIFVCTRTETKLKNLIFENLTSDSRHFIIQANCGKVANSCTL
ncbi:hypothetical protein KC19_12G054300 [Ceratodon purpureus]|uniref:Uncharacterized protein n=1 Tax=Ceratodon purpureus TaxID=3225 RepID=A0A8T0G431_CERPU|nr:hypothetical protein KC19_12G054300 [Ceratodon purpureus]